jgi:hypothetical protein
MPNISAKESVDELLDRDKRRWRRLQLYIWQVGEEQHSYLLKNIVIAYWNLEHAQKSQILLAL